MIKVSFSTYTPKISSRFQLAVPELFWLISLIVVLFTLSGCSTSSDPLSDFESQGGEEDWLTAGVWYEECHCYSPKEFPFKFRKLSGGDYLVGYHTIRTVQGGKLYKGYQVEWFPIEITGDRLTFKMSFRQKGHEYLSSSYFPIESVGTVLVQRKSATRLKGKRSFHFVSHNKDGSSKVLENNNVDYLLYKTE